MAGLIKLQAAQAGLIGDTNLSSVLHLENLSKEDTHLWLMGQENRFSLFHLCIILWLRLTALLLWLGNFGVD